MGLTIPRLSESERAKLAAQRRAEFLKQADELNPRDYRANIPAKGRLLSNYYPSDIPRGSTRIPELSGEAIGAIFNGIYVRKKAEDRRAKPLD